MCLRSFLTPTLMPRVGNSRRDIQLGHRLTTPSPSVFNEREQGVELLYLGFAFSFSLREVIRETLMSKIYGFFALAPWFGECGWECSHARVCAAA